MLHNEKNFSLEINDFKKDGFIIKRKLFSEKEVKNIMKSLETDPLIKQHMFDRDDSDGNSTLSVQWNNPGKSSYGVGARMKKIVNVVEELLGGEVYHWHSKVTAKAAKEGGAWEWHQDYGYWYNHGCLYPDMMSVMVALDKMGSEQEQFKKLQLGTLDGTMIAQNNAGPFYPKIDLFVLPYMLQNYEHAVSVADGPIGQEIWGNMAEEIGVHLVTIPLFSFRHIYNTKMPINNLDDFAKMKYRVPKNVVMIDTSKAFGSDPVPIAWSEALTATQTGTVDGGDLPIDVFMSQKFHDVAKHVAETGHFTLAPPFFVGDKFMQKLTDEQKEAMDMAAKVATAASRFHTNYGMSIVKEKLIASGVTFTQPDIGPWVELAKGVHKAFGEERGPEYVAIMDKIYAAAP